VLIAWLRAFVFTQIVEAPIYRRALGVSWPDAIAPSTLTHPLVWFVFPLATRILGLPWLVSMAAAELFAWLAEAFYLRARGVPLKKALLVSFVANAASLSLGLVSRAVFGAP
jgi:hypothetical protein